MDIVLRATVAFLFIFLLLRVIGRRELSTLEPFDLILLQDGKPVEKNLRAERMVLEEVAAEARQQQIESLDEVRWAVLETSGKISFIKK